ncbi:MAG: phosphoadenylyl-sulfate reductase [Gammaproteobacteria bacterium]|jgi:phosphoadenosine phosphosulfate reductase|nr:phosphoadenosine phosphosulfate reductase [Chromatiales bacterium]MDP6675367.1 phosphoadenylyl-sulfate reductase [Gammaproteobacteria bacterium]
MSSNSVKKIDLPIFGAIDAFDEHESRQRALDHCNEIMSSKPAQDRITWAAQHLPSNPVLSSSFGVQAAVSLHLVTQQLANIPVIFIDTGYQFPETYQFVDELTERLDLNLKIYSSKTSPAWQEARFGQRWNQGLKGLETYNQENKVEPMQRALRELKVGTWYAGLRRDQTSSRMNTPYLSWSGDRWKVHPIADWTDRDVYNYLNKHDLPYHPLWEQGYVSVGDMHTTKPLHAVDHRDQTRFFGLKRECGLHEIDLSSL